MYIIHMHWRKGRARTLLALVFSRYYLYRPVFNRNFWHVLGRQTLITWCGFLVFGREVYPHLNHLKYSTFFCPFGFVVFLVHNSCACGHPLHIPFGYYSVISTTITVLYLAFVS